MSDELPPNTIPPSTPFHTAPTTPVDTVPPVPPLCSPSVSARNVILFGEAGVGKSSVVNMLLGEQRAQTSTSARGCTFASVPYDVDLGEGVSVRVYDTAGLDESSAGAVIPENAVANLYDLLRRMKDGISLLVFVTRLGRITKRNQKNYRLFYEGICQSCVPIVLVVTHGEDACDDDANADDIGGAMVRWWDDNNQHFQRNNMIFRGQAVIVAKKCYQEEYEKSREKVRHLVRSAHLPNPWKMDELEWFLVSIKYVFSLFKGWTKSHIQMLRQTLSTDGRMLESEIVVDEIVAEMDSPAACTSNPITPVRNRLNPQYTNLSEFFSRHAKLFFVFLVSGLPVLEARLGHNQSQIYMNRTEITLLKFDDGGRHLAIMRTITRK